MLKNMLEKHQLLEFNADELDVQVWNLLQWQGKHAQTPSTAGLKTHYFCELSIVPTVRALLDECDDFWSSPTFTETLRAEWVLSDPEFFQTVCLHSQLTLLQCFLLFGFAGLSAKLI